MNKSSGLGLHDLSPDLREQVEQGIAALKRGGLVAYPTDTVYGLGASILRGDAVERVFSAKSRPREMALPLLVASVTEIEQLAGHLSPVARCLIDAFLPGALTLVLKASSALPDYVKTPEGTVAVRIPGHAVPLALIRGTGSPIVGTSANRSGQASPLTAAEVRSQIGDRVDLIIDGGRCPGRESTIVDVTGDSPGIIRLGAVSKEAIDEMCLAQTKRRAK